MVIDLYSVHVCVHDVLLYMLFYLIVDSEVELVVNPDAISSEGRCEEGLHTDDGPITVSRHHYGSDFYLTTLQDCREDQCSESSKALAFGSDPIATSVKGHDPSLFPQESSSPVF